MRRVKAPRTPIPINRTLCLLVVSCLLAANLGACGDDEPDAGAPRTVSVCEALRADNVDEVLRLDGRGTPIGRPGTHIGFVLRDGGCSIYVTTPGAQGSEVEDGERIAAIGRVAKLDRRQADRIEFSRGLHREFDEVPLRVGAPYFDAASLLFENLPQQS